MCNTFTCNYIPLQQRVTEQMVRNFKKMQNGFTLWHACRRAWPLQKIEFDAVVSTPRKLCALENILLYIYQVMAADPLDSRTIARELALGDSFFVDEMINDLATLGALEMDSSGRPVITDLGWQVQRRGEIPSKGRRQKLQLCFDMVAHEFTERLLFPDNDNSDEKRRTEDSNVALQLIVPGRRADANRLDLDTIRRVAARHDLLISDAVIFDAKPSEVVADDNQQADTDIICREVFLGMFFNEHGEIKLKVRDPKSKTATDWFQRVIDKQLKENGIDLSRLLGPLAVNDEDEATACTDTINRISINGDSINLSRIPAHTAQDRILAAVAKANQNLLIQTYGPGKNGNTAGLTEAIRAAAQRGICCRLLWAGTEINSSDFPMHKNIEHRSCPTIEREYIIVDDEKTTMAAMTSPITLPDGKVVASILAVGGTKARSACRKLHRHFQEKWDSAKDSKNTKAVPGSQIMSIAKNNAKQLASTATK